MTKVVITRSKLDNLAVAVSAKSGATLPLTIAQMQTAVENIPTSGGTLITKSITANGTYDAEDDNADGYSSVTVNVQSGSPTLQTKTKSYTPSETAQSETVTADSGYDGLSSVAVSVGAVSSTYVGTGITRRSSSDLTASGATVTVPSGYYQSQASKAVASGTVTAPSSISGTSATVTTGTNTLTLTKTVSVTPNVSTAGYISSGTAGNSSVSLTASVNTRSSSDLTVSGATVTAPAGYYESQATKSVASGTVTAPSTISGTSSTVSTGTNTITLSKTVSVTPNVTTAGYVSSGTAGNASVSLSASVTTKAAATITPTTSNQTIASGTYLTGAQTISGDANLIATNIKKDISIFGVTGSYEASGGGSGLTLLKTTALGSLSTSSTSAADTGKTMTVTGYNDYDVLVVDVSVDTKTNGRHTSTVSFVILTGTSNVNTKNTYTVAGNKWNSKLGSTGTASTRQSTTAYGVYVNAASVSSSTMTLTFYYRYNNNSTGTLNGTYTARVYGLNLIDLIGG